jgi:hypothetical protein
MSELNVAADDETLVGGWRRRLWANNLGVLAATIDSWSVSSFLRSWGQHRPRQRAPRSGRPDR